MNLFKKNYVVWKIIKRKKFSGNFLDAFITYSDDVYAVKFLKGYQDLIIYWSKSYGILGYLSEDNRECSVTTLKILLEKNKVDFNSFIIEIFPPDIKILPRPEINEFLYTLFKCESVPDKNSETEQILLTLIYHLSINETNKIAFIYKCIDMIRYDYWQSPEDLEKRLKKVFELYILNKKYHILFDDINIENYSKITKIFINTFFENLDNMTTWFNDRYSHLLYILNFIKQYQEECNDLYIVKNLSFKHIETLINDGNFLLKKNIIFDSEVIYKIVSELDSETRMICLKNINIKGGVESLLHEIEKENIKKEFNEKELMLVSDIISIINENDEDEREMKFNIINSKPLLLILPALRKHFPGIEIENLSEILLYHFQHFHIAKNLISILYYLTDAEYYNLIFDINIREFKLNTIVSIEDIENIFTSMLSVNRYEDEFYHYLNNYLISGNFENIITMVKYYNVVTEKRFLITNILFGNEEYDKCLKFFKETVTPKDILVYEHNEVLKEALKNISAIKYMRGL